MINSATTEIVIMDFEHPFGFLKCPDKNYIIYREDNILGTHKGLDVYDQVKWSAMSFVRAPVDIAQQAYDDAIEHYHYLKNDKIKTPYDDWGWRFFVGFGLYRLNPTESIIVAVDNELSIFYNGFFSCFDICQIDGDCIQSTAIKRVSPYFCELDDFFDDEIMQFLFDKSNLCKEK